jgi:hypothetical protein
VWGGEKCVQILVGKPEGKIIFGRASRRWEDNIKMDIEVVKQDMDRIQLAQVRD